ncbi:beta-lysine acetyltransferase [Anaerobacterium chartisolvens]|uniref:Beta-lysine acetyltransferase n=1 Tax=Anaerobacterium chartisolvens TaxID=1297424 RepID=A0A369BK53_9FIRM|nr:putative beta-lysine N-acetyltransferase [Anaerobacterium chartisolvens]RCX20074.1 beta-lysine acetyltransferase [Anaerobacterium chartisolvens]
MAEIESPQYGFPIVLEEEGLAANVYADLHNQRIKLLDYTGKVEGLPGKLILLCKKYRLGKVICTIPERSITNFLDAGYLEEGMMDGYFKGVKGYCLSYFADKKRLVSKNTDEEDRIVRKANEVKNQFVFRQSSFQVRTALPDDADSVANLFKEVFKTYPTPMDNPDYIKKVMGEHVLFKVALADGKLVSTASADIDPQMLHAEITDCATLPEYRGQGLLSQLVYHLEQELSAKGFKTFYSLSRALSGGINIVLSKHGYTYSGRLVNNCNIMGTFEDMNIWVKSMVQIAYPNKAR